MTLTLEQTQKNIDTYNRLNPPSFERDAQEARINALYDMITMTPDVRQDPFNAAIQP